MFVNTLGKCQVVKILTLRKILRKGEKTAFETAKGGGAEKRRSGTPFPGSGTLGPPLVKQPRGRRFNSSILLNNFPYEFCRCSQKTNLLLKMMN